MDLFKLLGTIAVDSADAKKELDEVSQKGNNTESKMSGAFSKIGKGAMAVGKAVGTGMIACGTAVAGLVTTSVNAYADYEQLVGGIDTLFGKSSAKVQEYAKNSYKTAGMSANEYMETVTGFSASLLQSLGNDTEKAAEKSNMALVDMSDNANKMGSDMESIKNAYSGFAKQNYTMLDNLKLGYGGTKEEMERLLADAEKFSGIKYDISSYADVVDAIHVIQTEMGITGTTSKEASSTISGSIASMKGSWQNLLTAISSDDLPFDEYVDNFVDSVSTVADNLMPRIQIALNGVISLISKLAPTIIAELPGLFSTLLPPLIEGAVGLMNALITYAPNLIGVLMGILPNIIEGLTQLFTAIIDALPVFLDRIIEGLMNALPSLINGLVQLVLAICENLPGIIEVLVTYLPMVLELVVNALMQNLPILIEGLISMIVALVGYMPQIMQTLFDSIPVIVQSVLDGIISAFPTLLQGVWDLIKGMFEFIVNYVKTYWNGIKTIFSTVCNAIKTIVSAVWNGIKSVISTVFDAIKSKVSTVWNGIKSTISNVVNGIKSKVSSIFNSIKTTASNIWNKVKTSMTNPIEQARDKIKSIVDKVKGFFTGMKLNFPKIKMPHFKIKPSGWEIGDLLKGKIPTLGIDWYAKAMNNPMIMTKPTIFGYNAGTGQLLGGGEAGSEVVSGTNTLLTMIKGVVSGEIGIMAYYLEQLINIINNYFPQVLQLQLAGHDIVVDGKRVSKVLAKPLNEELGKLSDKEERGQK